MPLKRVGSAYKYIDQALAKVHWHDDNIKTRLLHALVGAVIGYYTIRIATFVSMFLGLTLLTLELMRSVLMVPVNWQGILNVTYSRITRIGLNSSQIDWNWFKCRGLVSGLMLGASFTGMPFWSLILLRPVLGI